MGGEAGGDGAAGRVVEDGGWAGPAAGELGSGVVEVSGGGMKEGRVGVTVLAGVGGDAGEGEVGGGMGAEEARSKVGRRDRDGGRRCCCTRRRGLDGFLSGDPSPCRCLLYKNLILFIGSTYVIRLSKSLNYYFRGCDLFHNSDMHIRSF